MMDRLMKNTTNMTELVDLNEYVNKLEVGPWRNLLPFQDLKNQVSKTKPFSISAENNP